jgi:phenylalanine ammonia-lyase
METPKIYHRFSEKLGASLAGPCPSAPAPSEKIGELLLDEHPIKLEDLCDFVFTDHKLRRVQVTGPCRDRIEQSNAFLKQLLGDGQAVYGVTTGFGANSNRLVNEEQRLALQSNLVDYLLCGSGRTLPREATRAICMIRLKSLARGYSGVSLELIEQMKALIEHDLLPMIPCEGSLGASGDLIPLAYLGQVVQGKGTVETPSSEMSCAQAFAQFNLQPYQLQAKEGLSLTNGTSAMAGVALYNYRRLESLVELTCVGTSWISLILNGRTEAFEPLVNSKAKTHQGQSLAAGRILDLIQSEQAQGQSTKIQDRYSLRCAPQILGPIIDTLALVEGWIETEINSTSDNPLVDFATGDLAHGGNFYGGYLGHGADYMKVCAANLADLIDRQLMLLFETGADQNLPINLANSAHWSTQEQSIHHGLKGLHQAASAITSEILALATPHSIFSRSSESHNQDKVSLGMSANMGLMDQIEKLYNLNSLYLSCLAQALDLSSIKLRNPFSANLYQIIRSHVPLTTRDVPLGMELRSLTKSLAKRGLQGAVFR